MTPVLLHELLLHSAGESSRVAIIDEEREWSYGELRARAASLAHALKRAGIERGDRIGILLHKSFDECAAVFAASAADGVFIPINPTLRPAQIVHILSDSGARALICCDTLLTTLGDALEVFPDLCVLRIEETPTRDDWPLARNIGQDLAAILYTSGSTGAPKGVMLSHANLISGARIVRTYLGLTAQDRILSILPFSFDYGLNQLLTAVEQGAALALCRFQLGDQIVRALERHRITGLAGVPTLWAILTKTAPSLAKTELPHLRYITNSGGAVPEATVRALRRLLPSTSIYLMYGLTEAFRSTYLPPEEVDRRPTSIGKAIPECEVFPLTDDGRRAAPGEPGILVHRGPTVSLGYWRRPEETAKVLRPHPLRPPTEGGETVCWSGDLVVEDEEGFLYFVGRRDAMIKSAGFRISATEVEDALMSTGAFRQVAAIGLPDEWLGQKLCAVAAPDHDGVDLAAVMAEVATRLPAHMTPSRVDLVESLPTTPNGKVDYRRLVAERSQ